MNKNIYGVGAFALALAISGLPAVVSADEEQTDASAASTSVNAPVRAELRDKLEEAREEMQEKRAELASSTTVLSEEEREQMKQNQEQAREQAKQRAEIAREMLKDRFELLREGTTTPVFTLAQLKQSIEDRKHELDDEEASSTPKDRDLLKNANPVRLAVHTLLASKDILGGIGPQVSEIAKHMNDTIATTTSAEAQIQSRGFLKRLFFGGDITAADSLSQAVTRNEENMQKLTDLLNQASTTAELKATLETQIQALQDAQERLQELAQKERKSWGLFSWRFNK